MAYPATNFSEAVELVLIASGQLHEVINGDATEDIVVEGGEVIPSLRKALVDNFYFRDPIPWEENIEESTFNQLRKFTDGTFWYAPTATVANPVRMGETPVGDPNWLYSVYNGVSSIEEFREIAIEESNRITHIADNQIVNGVIYPQEAEVSAKVGDNDLVDVQLLRNVEGNEIFRIYLGAEEQTVSGTIEALNFSLRTVTISNVEYNLRPWTTIEADVTFEDKSIAPIKLNRITIGVIGDSTSEYTERGPSWPKMLEDLLNVRFGNMVNVVSAAIGGSTFETAQEARIGENASEKTQLDIIKEAQCDLIFVCLGFNDLLNGGGNLTNVIEDADNLFTKLRSDNENAHIVYVEEVAYDRNNITGDVYPNNTPIGLINQNVIPYLQEGQNLYGLGNVFATSSDFLESQLSNSKHLNIQNWIDLTNHIKTQPYIDSSAVMDMFMMYRCGMHSDLIHPDEMACKFIAMDMRKHIVDTPSIIGSSGNLGKFADIKSTSDTQNPNLLSGTEILRGMFTEIGSGVNTFYEYNGGTAGSGFMYFGDYPIGDKQFMWMFANRNIKYNQNGRINYLDDPFEFSVAGVLPQSNMYIQVDEFDASLSVEKALQAGTIQSSNRLNAYFGNDLIAGVHIAGLGFSYQGRVEFYRKGFTLVNATNNPNGGGGGDFDPAGNYDFTGNNTFGGAGFQTSIMAGGPAGNALLTFASGRNAITQELEEGGVVFWNAVNKSMNIGRTGADGQSAFNLSVLETGQVEMLGTNIVPQSSSQLATKGYVDSVSGGKADRAIYNLSGIVNAPTNVLTTIPVDTRYVNDNTSGLVYSAGQIIVSASSNYTEARATFCTRAINTSTGAGIVQMRYNSRNPADGTYPIVAASCYMPNGSAAAYAASGPWVPLTSGGTSFGLAYIGASCAFQGEGFQTWLEVQAR